MPKKMPHSKFNLTNTNLLTTGFGRLTPIYFQQVVPGDRLSLSTSCTIQLMPLLAPAFQDCRAYVHYYYVPQRVLYNDQQYNAFISREQRLLYQNGTPRVKTTTSVGDIVTALNMVYRNNSTGSSVPYLTGGDALLNCLPDYLRLQLGRFTSGYQESKESVIIEPLLAYFKIFLDHYVSTQYPTLFIESTSSSGDPTYLSLTYNQLLYIYSQFQYAAFDFVLQAADTWGIPPIDGHPQFNLHPLCLLVQIAHVMYGRMGDMFMEAYPTSEAAATSQNIGTTIESLRIANAVQKYNERKARVGHGISEFLWEFFHVKNDDNRLQMSRYLGGGRCSINIDDVPQTSQTTADSALAELGGNGWKKSAFGFGRRYFKEYGYVFGLLYVVPKQAYFQGMDNLWKIKEADDEYLEAFDSIGDEPIYERELNLNTNSVDNSRVLGYQPRYQRYKRVKNEIHGDFCSSLLYWHQSRKFSGNVTLASIRQVWGNPNGLNRIFNFNGLNNDSTEQPIMIYVSHKAKWRRKMRYNPRPHL